MVRHVLVPVEDSESSYNALEYAVSEYPDAQITALEVSDPIDLLKSDQVDNIFESSDQHEKDLRLQRVRNRAIEQGTHLSGDRTTGEVIGEILNYAAEHDVDHIVVGVSERSGTRWFFSENMTDKLSRKASIPVTIIQ
ncbi:universal stress protein [Halosolutus halophilus]|uniref:universal stress protein n=1 Tax=Halosolutus halophilus TaxID=1552990 RepID=UPI003CE54A6B